MKENLLNRLRYKIKPLSVNSLGNIYPDDLLNWLNISESELKEFITYLHDERILTYKYRFKCLCGEPCVVYENKLARTNGMCCEICGKEYSLQEVIQKSEILYEIDKRELFDLAEEHVDFKTIPTQKGKILNIVKKQKEDTMKIFLGSSTDSADYMEEIALKLQQLNQDTLMWNETGKGIFPPGTNTIDALVKITESVQAAVFIFNADDKIWNDKSSLEGVDTVRDNVLFEYGLFVGKLKKEKVCFVCKGKPKLASDLKGITYIDGDTKDLEVKNKLKDWLGAM